MTEQIQDVEYSEIMGSAYIDYSMSVIVDRAIPDIRDGLKPVQRRILYSMYELGVTHDRPHKKTARISGDVIGKYHPHGSQSCEDAIVTLAQKFKKNNTLIDGHGNFGSIEGDGAAAARYTEVRLEEFAEDCFLSDLKFNTVDFVSNYDETEQEPSVLPCKVPYLLINDISGIAVGMTTNIPPHNLGEVIDGAIYAVNHPKAKAEKYLDFIKGPDFITGGTICNSEDMSNIFCNMGEGKLRIRGTLSYESGKRVKDKDKLVITAIPFTIIGEGINKLLNEIAGLVENKTLPEIKDIIVESTDLDDFRIVLELQKDSDIEYIKNVLYAKTSLETTFGVHLCAIDGKTPKLLTYKDILDNFVVNQISIYTRKFEYLKEKAEKRCDVLIGLISAVDSIDTVTKIIKSSKNTKDANENLQKALGLNENQAKAILDMRLARLTNLDQDNVKQEYESCKSNIDQYVTILSDEKELKKEIIKELRAIKKKYAKPRKTEIESVPAATYEKKVEVIPVVVLMDRFGYFKCISTDNYNKNKESIDESYKFVEEATSTGNIIILTDKGNIYKISVSDIPYGTIKTKGTIIDTLNKDFDHKNESIISIISDSLCDTGTHSVLIATKNGIVNNIDMSELSVRRKSTEYITLQEDDAVSAIHVSSDDTPIIIGTKNNYFVKFVPTEIKKRARRSKGQTGIKLTKDDEVVYLSDQEPNGIKVSGPNAVLGTKGMKSRKSKIL